MNLGALVQTAMTAVPSALKADAVFTRKTRTQASATGQNTTVTTTIAGKASRGSGDPQRYRALGLIESEAPTLTFVPNAIGECPSVGDAIRWAGVDYKVKDVDPIAPAGVCVAASVIIER